MPTGDIYTTDTSGTLAIDFWQYEYGNKPIVYPTPIMGSYQEPMVRAIYDTCGPTIKKGGDEDMRYLYEVILVNPKNDTFILDRVVAKSETSALMKVYNRSIFEIDTKVSNKVEFDDLKTSCRVLMEWKKEKSLKKALETIKEAVE